MNQIYIGIAGHVVCLDKGTGSEIWKTKIKSASAGLTNLVKEGNQIIAYSGGHLFSLNAQTGDIQWENKLKGLGYSHCIIAGSEQSSGISASATTQQAAAAGAIVATTATAG